MTTFPVNVVTPLCETRCRAPCPKKLATWPKSASIPMTSPSRAPPMPATTCGWPAPPARSRFPNVVPPSNVTPTNGRICHSVDACAEQGTRSTSVRSPIRTSILRSLRSQREQPKEQPAERGGGQVARGQRERLHQAAAVGQQDQRQAAGRERHHERRRGVLADAELPHDRLAVVRLH